MIISTTSSSPLSAAAYRADHLAVLEDDDAIGEAHDVAHVVADQEDADALVAQALDEGADLRGFMGAQRRRRLVHDEDADVEMDGAGDGDRLALAARHLAHRPFDIGEIRVEAGERLGGLFGHPLLVEKAERGPQFAAEKEVRRRIEVIGQRQRLVDRLDRVAAGVVGRMEMHRFAGDADFPRGRRIDAGKDLDEHRFAGAVMADEGHDLARKNRQVDAFQRMQTAKTLGDASQLHKRFGGQGSLPLHDTA